MKILVTMPEGDVSTPTFFTERAKREIETLGEVVYNKSNKNFTDQELCKALKDVDIVFCGWGTQRYTEEILKHANKLKILAYSAGSMNGVVSDALYKKGIRVLGANCVFAESVAEGCLCYALASLRKIEKYVGVMRNGGWKKDDDLNAGLLDKTVGLIGFGKIAQYFAEMLKPFHVKLKIVSSHLSPEQAKKYNAEIVTLEEACSTCDVISLHYALSDKTYHMIDKEHIKTFKDNALFINTSRGAIVDESALIEELKTGRISAVLDVFEREGDDLAVDNPLRTLPNVLPMPHMGGPSIDRREYCVLNLVRDIRTVLANPNACVETDVDMEYASRMTVIK